MHALNANKKLVIIVLVLFALTAALCLALRIICHQSASGYYSRIKGELGYIEFLIIEAEESGEAIFDSQRGWRENVYRFYKSQGEVSSSAALIGDTPTIFASQRSPLAVCRLLGLSYRHPPSGHTFFHAVILQDTRPEQRRQSFMIIHVPGVYDYWKSTNVLSESEIEKYIANSNNKEAVFSILNGSVMSYKDIVREFCVAD